MIVFSYIYIIYKYIVSIFSTDKIKYDTVNNIRFVSYRNLNRANKKIVKEAYEKALSPYSESYTSFKEIKYHLSKDNDFHLDALMVNNNIVGAIQYKYINNKMSLCIIDYIYLIQNSYIKEFYRLKDRLPPDTYIVAEITFDDNKRNKALNRLIKRHGFTELKEKYYQPPMGDGHPVEGKLFIANIGESKESSRNHHSWKLEHPIVSILFTNKLIHNIYYNHYYNWYYNIPLYKEKLDELWSRVEIRRKNK